MTKYTVELPAHASNPCFFNAGYSKTVTQPMHFYANINSPENALDAAIASCGLRGGEHTVWEQDGKPYILKNPVRFLVEF